MFTVINSDLFYFPLNSIIVCANWFFWDDCVDNMNVHASFKLVHERSMAMYLTTPSAIYQLYRCGEFER